MEQTALKFTLQQGVAVAVCIAVAMVFGLAIVKLFKAAKEERAEAAAAAKEERAAAAAERDRTRADYSASLAKHGEHLDKLGTELAENSRVLERVADRLGSMPAKRVA